MAPGYIATEDYVVIDEDINFDKFMDDICEKEEQQLKRVKLLKENEIPYRKYGARYHEKASNRMKIAKR